MRLLRRAGLVQPGTIVTGTMTWTRRGVALGEAAVRVDLTKGDVGVLTVAFTLNGEPHRQEVSIIPRPLPYGGARYYFLCPRSQRRCETLALLDATFASRQAHRLAYASQSEDQLGRLNRKVERLGAQLWPEERGRPRGRNRQLLCDAWVDASTELDRRLDAAMCTLEALEARPGVTVAGRGPRPASALQGGGF